MLMGYSAESFSADDQTRKMINEDIIFLNDKLMGYSAESFSADDQTRHYKNLGIGAALVAGLAYWIKR